MVTRNVTIEGYLDKRLVFRQFLKGEMTEADLEALLRDLPDVSYNVEEIRVEGQGKQEPVSEEA